MPSHLVRCLISFVGGQGICNLAEAIADWSVRGYVVAAERTKDEREVNEKLGDRVFREYVRPKRLFYILYPSLVKIHSALKKPPKLEVNIQGTIEDITKLPLTKPEISEYSWRLA